eukprot:6910217-Pyramimonas_sp.AAC.1
MTKPDQRPWYSRGKRARRGSTPSGKPVVHLIDAHCKSHRLQVRSSYSAGTLAAAHNSEDCYPTIVTLHELHAGPLTPTQLRNILELGGLSIKVILTIDAEYVFKPSSSKDLKKPTECTFWTHQLDTTDDGSRNRAQYSVARHPRYDCG